MSDTTGETTPQWVRSPSATAEVNIQVPHGANLDAGLLAAIEDVLRAMDSHPETHPTIYCKQGSCQPKCSGDCFELVTCVVKSD